MSIYKDIKAGLQQAIDYGKAENAKTVEYEESSDCPCDNCSRKDSCDGWEAQFCCQLCYYYNSEPNCESCDPMDI